ncbi:hypothetical protein GIB67_015362 [Kingdonia uniflora]|uniref:Uncharacterized protein n=1 Tax=Kingdonia uniflora TaxID=39325 RepID=A0A7J7KYT2_9MAGN|nr:hypothetical protein GIB67_015362 [Kingdonia uniflora]
MTTFPILSPLPIELFLLLDSTTSTIGVVVADDLLATPAQKLVEKLPMTPASTPMLRNSFDTCDYSIVNFGGIGISLFRKENPFETIWSCRKFDLVGKKRKGEEQRAGLARSRGNEKRKMTLLKEYKQSGKSSVFEDKRIGEQDKTLGEFDKAILRRKRQLKVDKKSKYNLSDGEEDEGAIYGGGSFLEKDDYEDELSADDEAKNNKNDIFLVSTEKSSSLIEVNEHSMHNPMVTGLTEGEENKHKTKKEVMEEVILKSKYFKAQKAKDKEDNEDLKEQLDKNFTSLIPSEAFLSLTQPNKMIALKTLSNKGISADSIRKEEAPTSLKKESVIQVRV